MEGLSKILKALSIGGLMNCYRYRFRRLTFQRGPNDDKQNEQLDIV
jgi:hypothetical protein